MSRAASSKAKIISLVVALAIIAVGLGGWAYFVNSPSHPATVSATRQSVKSTEVSYKGEAGVDALTLLKKHAKVETKHYSFGDQVTSIDGVPGNGPKYWTFFVNGKMASEGAASFITKASDSLSWRLQ